MSGIPRDDMEIARLRKQASRAALASMIAFPFIILSPLIFLFAWGIVIQARSMGVTVTAAKTALLFSGVSTLMGVLVILLLG